MEGLLISYSIVPYDATFDAKYEVRRFLNRLSKKYPFLEKAKMIVAPNSLKGLIIVDLREYRDKIELIGESEFKKRIEEEFEIWQKNQDFLYVKKLKTLDFLVENEEEKLLEVMQYYAEIVDDRWRLTLKSRGRVEERRKLIEKLAEPIKQKVDLENPKYNIYIEILGSLVGFRLEKN